jgi:hypothetical protein
MRQLVNLTLEMVPAASDGWLLVGHLSSLTQLTVIWSAQHLTAPPSMWCTLARLTGLQSLKLWWWSATQWFNRHQSLNIKPVSTLTQLQSLELNKLIDSSFSCTVLTTLVGLTSLGMFWPKQRGSAADTGSAEKQQQQQEKQQQGQLLRLAISHLKHLRELSFSNILVPASIATTLGQLTGLTRLWMHKTMPDAAWYSGVCHNPVVLPSVKQLTLYGQAALHFLAGTHLPLLAKVELNAKLCAETTDSQAQLLRSRMGLLHHCPVVTLSGQGKEVAVDELGPILATLASAWKQPSPQGRRDVLLKKMHCPRPALSQLPAQLASLGFW